MIDILLVEPNKQPKVISIENNYESERKIVGGNIEIYCPFPEDDVAIICNSEEKNVNLPLNRHIIDKKSGKILDIIAGTFIVVGTDNETFISLSDKYAEKYTEIFSL